MALSPVVLLLVCCVGCDCLSKSNTFIKDHAFANKMCPTNQVEFTKITKSAVSCVLKCSEMPGCASLIYLYDNKTCFGIKSNNPFDTSSPLQGTVFYKPSSSATTTTVSTTVSTTTEAETTTTTTTVQLATTYAPGTPMVEGSLDSQFTASTTWGTCCEPWQARFSCTDNPWASEIQDTNQWIQVDFINPILATHVSTKGAATFDRWVTSYQVLISDDCATFAVVKDDLGNDMVFTGNTDRNTTLQHALEPPVTCRCIRFNPITWIELIGFRVEVLGHVI